jgi:molybdenum cofactor synthesis domain-containing protein
MRRSDSVSIPDSPSPVTAAMLVIGDEILSGRTGDKNIATVARFCTGLGIELREARVVADDEGDIVGAVNALRTRYDYVFTSGGIGPTHDDITAKAMAVAFDVPLEQNRHAEKMIVDQYRNKDLTPARARMARIPAGAELVTNFVSGAPGFRFGNVFVMAGVPIIMEAMLEAIAPMLKGGRTLVSWSIDCGVGESVVAEALGAIQDEFDDIRIGSYPQMGKPPIYTQLVLRGTNAARLEQAKKKITALVETVHREHGISL